MESGKPVHLVQFEDLAKNPIDELQKIVKFLEKANEFKENYFEQRLICLSENIQGSHKRKKTKQQIDPYTKSLKIKINAKLNFAQNVLIKYGLNVDLSNYKRELD